MKPDSTFRSSTARLAIAYGTVVLLLVIALQGTVFLMTRQALRSDMRNIVATELEHLTEDFNTGGIDELVRVLRSRTDSWDRTGAVYMLADASLEFLAGNFPIWPAEVLPYDGQEVQFSIRPRGSASRGHPVWAKVELLPGNYWLLIGTDISESQRSLRRFGIATAWGVALLTALIGLLGWWYSRHTVQRVRDISATCDSIVHSDLSRRLEVGRRSDEFEQLSNTINNMLGRLEQQAAVLRTTFGSVAHDLRTPLYRLRVRLEEGLMQADTSCATRELVAPALEELDRVQRTLGTLLEIARAEGSGPMADGERIDLAQLASEMHELYQPGMQERGLELKLLTEGDAILYGKRQLLAQLIANLLENTIKYVPSGGTVQLNVRNEGQWLTLSVSDNGPGMTPGGKPAGSGLGLNLVKAIARLHRGEVALHDNAPGLTVECRFEPGARQAPTRRAA